MNPSPFQQLFRRVITVVPSLRRRVLVARWLSSTSAAPPSVVSNKAIPFAVEAPDGSSEALKDAELHQVEDIIDHASKFEDLAFVQQLHNQQQDAAKTFAVDAPDGEADDIHQQELHAVEEVITYAAEHEDKKEVLLSHKVEEAVVKVRTGRRVPDYSQVPKG